MFELKKKSFGVVTRSLSAQVVHSKDGQNVVQTFNLSNDSGGVITLVRLYNYYQNRVEYAVTGVSEDLKESYDKLSPEDREELKKALIVRAHKHMDDDAELARQDMLAKLQGNYTPQIKGGISPQIEHDPLA